MPFLTIYIGYYTINLSCNMISGFIFVLLNQNSLYMQNQYQVSFYYNINYNFETMMEIMI